MNRLIMFLAFIIFSGQPLQGQIYHSHLKEYAEKEAAGWASKLNLSNFKTAKLAEVLFQYKVKEGDAVLDRTIDFKNAQESNMEEKQNKLKSLLSSQEYKLYLLLNEYSRIDRVEYLRNLTEEYTKDEKLVSAIVNYREQNILPILRVHRGELEMRMSKADREALSIIRVELYETLDKCIIECTASDESNSQHYKSLDEVLFKEITSQVNDKMSLMNHLLQITKKYEEEIDIEKSHFDKHTAKWNDDMAKIHENYILDNHIEEFRKTLESNSVVAWKHLRFDAFFMLLDPSTEEEAKKILKLGMIVLPHLKL